MENREAIYKSYKAQALGLGCLSLSPKFMVLTVTLEKLFNLYVPHLWNGVIKKYLSIVVY